MAEKKSVLITDVTSKDIHDFVDIFGESVLPFAKRVIYAVDEKIGDVRLYDVSASERKNFMKMLECEKLIYGDEDIPPIFEKIEIAISTKIKESSYDELGTTDFKVNMAKKKENHICPQCGYKFTEKEPDFKAEMKAVAKEMEKTGIRSPTDIEQYTKTEVEKKVYI